MTCDFKMLNCTICLLIFSSFICIFTCKLFISKHTFTNCHSLDSNFENMLRFIHWNHLLSGPPRLNILFNCHLPCQHWYFLLKMPIRIFYPHNKFMLNYISCIDIIILHVNTINSHGKILMLLLIERCKHFHFACRWYCMLT